MKYLKLVMWQVIYEQKSFWRNPASAFFTFLFPIVFLVVFGSIYASSTVQVGNQTISYDNYYVPSIVAFGLMGATFTNLAMTLSIRRDLGILKRLRGTPLPTWVFIAGLLGSAFVISIVLAAITTGFGMVFYSVFFPRHIFLLLGVLVIGSLGFAGMGIAVSAIVPNADAAPAVVNGIFLPIVFISGTFFPISPSNVLARIAQYFPIHHFNTLVYSAFDPAAANIGLSNSDILILVLWGVGGTLFAARRFRWEARKK